MRTSNLLDRDTDYFTPNKIVPAGTDSDYCDSCGSHWTQSHAVECTA